MWRSPLAVSDLALDVHRPRRGSRAVGACYDPELMDHLNFYIDGAWVPPAKPATRDVINPATEQPIGRISMGGAEDVDRAVKAARKAFATYSRTTREERIALLENILKVYKTRHEELVAYAAGAFGYSNTYL